MLIEWLGRKHVSRYNILTAKIVDSECEHLSSCKFVKNPVVAMWQVATVNMQNNSGNFEEIHSWKKLLAVGSLLKFNSTLFLIGWLFILARFFFSIGTFRQLDIVAFLVMFVVFWNNNPFFDVSWSHTFYLRHSSCSWLRTFEIFSSKECVEIEFFLSISNKFYEQSSFRDHVFLIFFI